MAQHAFVAMPFGIKEGIDFNKVYKDYIKPALDGAGFEVFRADEELRAGNIRTDMFQELLLADLVVVDLSIDNPNVWYELGVRHALRPRGVIQVQCKRDYLPFDVYVDRALRYHVKDDVPDPDYLEADKKALANSATETMESWYGRRISPVYHLLPFLKQPDWKSLRVGGVNEFWEAQEKWESRIEVARKRGRPGDILVLAEEAPTRVLRLEAHRTAGKALRELGQFAFALEQYEKALAIDPTELESQLQKGILLGRLKKADEAKEWLKAVVKDHPDDAESWALLGRAEKDAWTERWRQNGKTTAQMREDAACEEGLLHEAINAYLIGFCRDPSHYYSGINAVTLSYLLKHLTRANGKAEERKALEGGVRWAVECALIKDQKDYWARVTLGDLEILSGSKKRVEEAYKAAVAIAEKNWFALDSARQQLWLLKDLGFRPPEVEAALKIFDHELNVLKAPEARWVPNQVLLFSGHLIDAPGRAEPRFPSDKERIAAAAIAAKLDELEAGSEDLALCGGACGGDLLFAEACLQRGLHLEVYIPFDEPIFLRGSVTSAGDQWRDRFYKVKAHPLTRLLIMPEELGPLPKKADPYARNNLWQLYTALAWGPEKVCFICLWDRKEGDGPGGTKHMYDTVLKHSGQVHVLDTTKLW
jgi:tetratricopeptide (TPR) repeat protein